MIYQIAEKTPWGMVTVMSRYGEQIWMLSNRNVRKDHFCASCYARVLKGSERMYRPLGDPVNRSSRICVRCVEKSDAPLDA